MHLSYSDVQAGCAHCLTKLARHRLARTTEVIEVIEAIPADRFREVSALVSLEERIDALSSRVTLVEVR